MNKRNGVFGSMLSLGAVGAAIFGVTRGLRNGTFQPMLNNIKSMFGGTAAQKAPNAVQGMMSEQGMMNEAGLQKTPNSVQGMMKKQNNNSQQ
ncbi:hypothetical protein [Jeotgalibacillus proteolyticus]|uniref:Uncharacterized protein n=1 Tax=Jeotgalibacillus proteolyticus TaxID=2082395 RepID=A0A2S5G6X2_9BACL|nr:hypothetical protein [Jeotgalibacillus proteolyticus]PPA68738.1 hypothetical protein C4B60_19425 [Jeotgalibacillus proteolyticus]